MPKKLETENIKRKTKIKSNRLYRSEKNKILGGVAAGLGEYLDVDPTLLRIAFVLVTLFGGSGILLYLVLWLVIPSKSDLNSSPELNVKHNADEIKEAASDLADNLSSGDKGSTRYLVGLVIIGLGLLFMFENLGILPPIDLGQFWPIILIGVGFVILSKK